MIDIIIEAICVRVYAPLKSGQQDNRPERSLNKPRMPEKKEAGSKTELRLSLCLNECDRSETSLLFSQLQRAHGDSVLHPLRPAPAAAGARHVLDRVRHETQRSHTSPGGCTRPELVPVPQPGRHRLARRRGHRRVVGDSEMLLVRRSQVLWTAKLKEEVRVTRAGKGNGSNVTVKLL